MASVSDTSDQQRFDEMFIHLTPRGATVPYSVCFDQDENIWVGGLFKFDGKKKTTLWEMKNMFPKKMAAFPQVISYKDKIIYSCAEDKAMTIFRILSLSGETLHESFIDGQLISLAVSDSGELFASKQPQGSESVIVRTSVDVPLGWEELITSDDFSFQTLLVLDDNTLVAAMAELPITMYSKQRMVLIDIEKGVISKKFSEAGKEPGKIFFPRSIKKYDDGMAVMDKSGRFQKFDKEGNYVSLIAQIDAYLGNGFCIKDNSALMALSGIVLDQEGRSICDDWLEWIALDGSSWKDQRAKKTTSS